MNKAKLENAAYIYRQVNFLTLNLRIQTSLVTGDCEGLALIGTGAEENACSLGTAGFQKEGRAPYLVLLLNSPFR